MSIRCTIFCVILAAGAAAAQDAPPLKSENDKISYALGMDLGNQLRKLSISVDAALFGQGLKDALSAGKTLLDEEQVRAAISGLQAELKRRQAAVRKGAGENNVEVAMLAAHNKTAGEAFLAKKKTLEGVITLPSGLEYRIVKQGSGKKPGPDDTVTCHYRGTLLDGTEFYDTYKRRQPMSVKVNGTIQAFTEALQLMPVGSKWELFVPPQLAYGEVGAGPVGPNSTLVYEVELLAIN